MIALATNRLQIKLMTTERLAYEIVRSKKRRTAAIKVEPGQVRVLVPHWVDDRWIEGWVAEKRHGIIQKQQRLAEQGEAFEIRIAQQSEIPFLGQTLRLDWQYGSRNHVERVGDQLRVILSRRGSRPEVERVTDLVKSWYQTQAQSYLSEGLQHWQQITGLVASGLTVKSFRRRWGSCDNRGHVSLNWRLVMAPADQVDYVIVHELAHLKHFNHSKRFWALVATFVAQYNTLRLGLQCRYPLLYF